jgi:hypothetical protein
MIALRSAVEKPMFIELTDFSILDVLGLRDARPWSLSGARKDNLRLLVDS